MRQGEIVAAKIAAAPKIDGVMDDVWKNAKEYTIGIDVPANFLQPTETMTVRVTHDGTNVYFLLQWEDTTHSIEHQVWKWSEIQEAYDADFEVEDVGFIAFEMEGVFNANMVAGIDAKWDCWYWKAARTDPVGYAMDKYHVYTRKEPEGKSAKVRLIDGTFGWIQRPQDAGKSVTGKRDKPTKKGKVKELKYVPQIPDGSAADVRAKGVWKDDIWTVEFSRKLNTGYPDDTAFDVAKTYGVAFGVQKHTEHEEHLASMPWTLRFGN